ncbi:MAG: hypothetical protein QOJ07_1938 [Thermoleophilaceae bacterium]|nr:hypothetical protein [Thermoleophilaceae bacterium]
MRHFARRARRVTLLAVLLAFAAATPAAAVTFTVNSTSDAADINPNDGTCNSSSFSTVCTLRAAIQTANLNGNGGVTDQIVVPAGTYSLTVLNSSPEDAAATGDLDITAPVSIQGAGARTTVIVGELKQSPTDRVFDVRGGATGVTISGLAIQNGGPSSDATGGGAALRNLGSATLQDVAVVANDSGSFPGGGIYNDTSGVLSLVGVTVAGNRTTGGGGGVFNAGGMGKSLMLNNSTISGNSAGSGGGLGSGNNTAPGAVIAWTTIANNDARSGPGAIAGSGSTSLESSIVSANTSGTNVAQCNGSISSTGHNVDSGTACSSAAQGDRQSQTVLLGALGDNGGQTDTHLPQPGSPAIDAGATTGCPAFDQRGIARPIGIACDAGSVEAPAPPPPPPPAQPSSLTLAPASADRAPGDANAVTATLLRSDGSPAVGIVVRYSITGANPGGGTVTTDAAGTAQISWEGIHEGADTLSAYADTNGDAAPSTGEPTASATVNWTLPTPKIAKTVNLDPLSGVVKVKLPPGTPSKADPGAHAAASYIPLEEARTVPVGTIVDARRGRVGLDAIVKRGSTATRKGEFYSGAFQIVQASAARPTTELRLTEQLQCTSTKSGLSAARSRTRHLWGKDHGGRFRTRGRNSSASVRGTTWYSKDTCNSTTTVVREGSVVVKDFGKHANVTVKAGHRYVARAKKKRH